MKFDDYQKQALETDQVPYRGEQTDDKVAQIVVPLLGLASETGELLSEYKKYLRDGESHMLFKEQIAEELGDLLWYLSNVASKFDLSLGEIASANLAKINERWGGKSCSIKDFDEGFPPEESFPRRFEVELRKESQGDKGVIQPYLNGEKFGNVLTDNYREDDGYRFHDVFHLAYVAVLGWSPVIRALLGKKRKSRPDYDNVEDGGRAIVIDEGIVALVFSYASKHNKLSSTDWVDYDLLRTIKSMTEHLEVGERTTGDWEKAIIDGFSVWRKVVERGGGKMSIDIDAREIKFIGD